MRRVEGILEDSRSLEASQRCPSENLRCIDAHRSTLTLDKRSSNVYGGRLNVESTVANRGLGSKIRNHFKNVVCSRAPAWKKVNISAVNDSTKKGDHFVHEESTESLPLELTSSSVEGF